MTRTTLIFFIFLTACGDDIAYPPPYDGSTSYGDTTMGATSGDDMPCSTSGSDLVSATTVFASGDGGEGIGTTEVDVAPSTSSSGGSEQPMPVCKLVRTHKRDKHTKTKTVVTECVCDGETVHIALCLS